jgi:GAF domain-containing protein
MAAKTTSKTQKAKPRSRVKASAVTQRPTYAELCQELEARNRDLAESLQRESATAGENEQLRRERDEALEHQTATAEVLGIISRSPTDVQPVLHAIVESAARVCGIDDVVLWLRDGPMVVPRAHFGSMPVNRVEISIDDEHYCWMREHGVLHVPDVRAQSDFPMLGTMSGWRTFLGAPLFQQGELIGALHARRTEVRPFTPTQIKLLETFADQAVIAIENVRLFNELKESLEQQTATSEILGVIASSPTDVQPVLDVVVENAARLCDVKDASIFRIDGDMRTLAAVYGPMPSLAGPLAITRETPVGRAIVDRQTVHVQDLVAEIDTVFPDSKRIQQVTGTRTALATPLLREGIPVGAIYIRRTEVRPFAERQIKLLETFADQAVIALENVRLFNELKESLEQQTATSEILGVIARSPTDIRPVLDTVAENAARLCGASEALIRRIDGDVMPLVAQYGQMGFGEQNTMPLSRVSVIGRAALTRQTIHVHDLAAESDNEYPVGASLARQHGARTLLATPLLREGVSIGGIVIRRKEVRPFTDKQIKLLETFASQAVIAIENVRLFKEIQERNAELREALEHQTATSEVLGIISRSPTDVQPVLDAIVESAGRVCGVDDVLLRLREENTWFRGLILARYSMARSRSALMRQCSFGCGSGVLFTYLMFALRTRSNYSIRGPCGLF